MNVLYLPWPNRDLHPNARVHWARRARVAHAAREFAAWEAKAKWVKGAVPAGPLALLVTFCAPDRRRRDQDGCLSAIKAYLDGIADAMRFDDSRIAKTVLAWGEPKRGGEVVVRLEAA